MSKNPRPTPLFFWLFNETVLHLCSTSFTRRTEFAVLRDYFRELAGALSNIQDAELDAVTKLDVTWDSGHAGAVIDYAEWRAKNYSALGANKIEELAVQPFGDGQARLSPIAKVNLYVKYLKRAAHG